MRHDLGRRDFLRRAGTGVLVASPIWSWATERQGPPARTSQDAAGWVTIPTREHHGDTEERLQMPPSWNVKVYEMAGHNRPVLTPEQIRKRIEEPIGTRRLAEIAGGKRSAVITFDDLTRPTPTFEVVPHVIGELRLAGLNEDLRTLFELTKLDSLFNIADSATSALAGF